MFGGTSDTPSTSMTAMRILAYGIVFALLNMSFVTNFIKDKLSESDIAVIGIKTLTFVVILLIFQLFGW